MYEESNSDQEERQNPFADLFDKGSSRGMVGEIIGERSHQDRRRDRGGEAFRHAD
jgi:hypothetical protein